MENIKKMCERHEAEIATLRESCKHSHLTAWMPWQWAPGHFSGDVKLCKRCGKRMKEKPSETFTSTTTSGSSPVDVMSVGVTSNRKVAA